MVTTVTRLMPAKTDPSIAAAIEAFLGSPNVSASSNTLRAYTGVLDRIAAELGGSRLLVDVDGSEISEVLETLWGSSAPATWNQRRAVVIAWLSWCREKKHWQAPEVPADLERRRENIDQSRAIGKTTIARLCRRRDVPLREKTLWRMLYETAARASSVLALNVEDLDLAHKQAPVRVKGGDTMWITWGTDTAHLLPRYLAGRTEGPLFLSTQKPGPRRRAAADARDVDPETGHLRLGYDGARLALARHSAGLQLHQLRHSAATHLGDAGVSAPIIMAKGGWKSLRTAARYTRPGLPSIHDATEHLASPLRRG